MFLFSLLLMFLRTLLGLRMTWCGGCGGWWGGCGGGSGGGVVVGVDVDVDVDDALR